LKDILNRRLRQQPTDIRRRNPLAEAAIQIDDEIAVAGFALEREGQSGSVQRRCAWRAIKGKSDKCVKPWPCPCYFHCYAILNFSR
jgi:hypothetical protein